MKKTTIMVVLSIFCVLIVLSSMFAFVSCNKGESESNANIENLDETFSDVESENNEINVNSKIPDETSSDVQSENNDNNANSENPDETSSDVELDYIENSENIDETSSDVVLESRFYAVFQPESSEIDENIGTRLKNTAKSLEDLLFESGYTEAVISLEDNNSKIRVEVPDVDNIEEIIYLIGRPVSVELRKEQQGETPSSTPYVTSKELENAYVSMNYDGQYVVALELNSVGTVKLAAATEERNGSTISIWINGEWKMSPVVNAVITNGKIVIEGNYTYEEAYDLATQIQAGAFDVNLQLVEADKIMVRPDANAGELAK